MWVQGPVTWGVIPGWAETIWSIEDMALIMVYEGFLIETLECLPLVLRGLLWDFPNKQVTKEGSFLILLSFLGITPLLDSLSRDLKEQWFILWCQTRISLSSRPKRSSVDHSLAMSSLVSSDPIAILSTSFKLVGILG